MCCILPANNYRELFQLEIMPQEGSNTWELQRILIRNNGHVWATADEEALPVKEETPLENEYAE